MPISEIRLRGEVSETPAVKEESEFYSFEKSYSISPATRSDAPEQKFSLTRDHLIEIVLEDNTVWIGNQDTIEELFPESSSLHRGDSGEWTLPSEITEDSSDRNIIKSIALKFVNLFVKKQLETKIGESIGAIAKKLEDKQFGAEKQGLYSVGKDFEMKLVNGQLATGEYLLFLHGTGSSSKGSFEELKSSNLWTHIQTVYKEGNVLALQHRTLTESPLTNIKKLVEQLPAIATIDLISHSRGGLVADLLCRFAADARGFDSNERLCLEKEGRADEIPLIEAIEKLIRGKKITIRKQIRVACPARGTILAGKRTHDLFNVTLNLLGLTTGQSANPAYIAFKELILAVIETKDNTKALPGIEAMNPESPFIKALNFPGSSILVPTTLMVIAGNSRVSLKLRGLLIIAGKLFFMEGNDLVVNTASMYQGVRRQQGKGFYYLEQTGETHHLAYFSNESSRLAITAALNYSGEGRLPGFEPMRADMQSEMDRNAALGLQGGKVFLDEVSGKKPIVVLLPGIMGSNLLVKDEMVWINYFKFLGGELTSLEYSEDNNRQVKAHSLIKTSYKKLADYLSTSYDVVTFPFDWRMPLDASTDAFDLKLKELMKANQPIRIIGHSMGGVLVRDFILSHKKTWDELNKLPGFRLILLGAPLGGSFRIPYVLFGFDDIIKKLAAIDIKNSKKDLLQVFSNMPGLLSLLPISKDSENDFAKSEVWEKLRAATGDADWPIPSETVLNHFSQYRDKILAEAKDIDYKNVVYIAGACRKGKSTPCAYRVDNHTLQFLSTTEGDESVTWATGIPAELSKNGKVYYSNVTHGELANDTSLFPVIGDVLLRGETTRLRTSPPLVRSIEKLFISPRSVDLDVSESGIEKTLLGLSVSGEYQPFEPPLNVSITNGDLSFARHPVLVGHFENDGIVSAEWVIDQKLGGELSRRHKLGLHPGLIEQNELILTGKNPGTDFQGTIIVGLGKQGELTGYNLMRSIEKGITKYLSVLNVRGQNQPYVDKPPKVGISPLVIGGSYGGLSIETSLRSILLGIQNANRRMRSIYGQEVRVIEEIEIIELFRDRALSAITTIKAFEQDENGSFNIILANKKMKEKLGQQQRIPIDNTTDWWTRISVRKEDDTTIEEVKQKPKRRALVMTISTTGAREEKRNLLTGSETLFQLIEDMSTKNLWSPCHGKTLFELLIPTDFKDQVKRQGNINWIIDKYSAGIPWELMQDTSGNDLPLCVHAGMVRQLATQNFRVRVNQAFERRALVIADPDLKGYFSQLPGALEEGKMVYDLLATYNYKSDKLFSSNASDIFKSLMCNDYKIIHLAGHGVFNADDPSATGMVLGKDSFLTVAEIAQMGTVPELVFVNCCFLGKTDAKTEELTQNRYMLAANIGTQLIENGVKAVIAAGWAVDDMAALTFADVFYHQMLIGSTFGEAVKKARKKVYQEHGNRSNTWGAYQCYGDPFFKLDNGKTSYVEEHYDFVMAEEAEIRLNNLQNKLETGRSDSEKALKSLSKIIDAVNRSGISNAAILEREARILVMLNKYEDAIEKYKNLFNSEKADFMVSALEQYNNIRVKHIVAQMNQENAEWTSGELESVIGDLQALIRIGKTSERLSLLGSTFKRQISIYGTNEKPKATQALFNAIQAYKEAFNVKRIAYPLNNWLQFEAIALLANEGIKNDEFAEFVKNAMPHIKEQMEIIESEKAHLNNFWDRAIYPNLLLTKFLLGIKGNTIKKVTKAYLDLWEWAGNSNDKLKEIEHFALIELSLSLFSNAKATELAAGITQIKEDLQKAIKGS
jgi:CHAT domain-containing protein